MLLAVLPMERTLAMAFVAKASAAKVYVLLMVESATTGTLITHEPPAPMVLSPFTVKELAPAVAVTVPLTAPVPEEQVMEEDPDPISMCVGKLWVNALNPTELLALAELLMV